jgi:hypothetical protein
MWAVAPVLTVTPTMRVKAFFMGSINWRMIVPAVSVLRP